MTGSACGPGLRRRYWIWMGGYVVAIFAGALLVTKPPHPDAPHLAAAIIPLVPLVLGLGETFRTVRSMDELQRRIHYDALLLSLLGTAAIVLGVGMLQIMAGIALFSVFWLWVPMSALYTMGVVLGRRRYS